jgi:hypothetical protein
MEHISGIQFLVDAKGRKTAGVIDLKGHRALWEDFYDGVISSRRAKEPHESLEVERSKRRRVRKLTPEIPS